MESTVFYFFENIEINPIFIEYFLIIYNKKFSNKQVWKHAAQH